MRGEDHLFWAGVFSNHLIALRRPDPLLHIIPATFMIALSRLLLVSFVIQFVS